jgi:hypothetical protein
MKLSSVTMSIGAQGDRYLYHDLEGVTLEPVILNRQLWHVTNEEYFSNWVLISELQVGFSMIQFMSECKLAKFIQSENRVRFRTLFNQYIYYDADIDRCYLMSVL